MFLGVIVRNGELQLTVHQAVCFHQRCTILDTQAGAWNTANLWKMYISLLFFPILKLDFFPP